MAQWHLSPRWAKGVVLGKGVGPGAALDGLRGLLLQAGFREAGVGLTPVTSVLIRDARKGDTRRRGEAT